MACGYVNDENMGLIVVNNLSDLSGCNTTDNITTEAPFEDRMPYHASFVRARYVCYNIIMPIILGFGIIGNVLNIIILCQQRLHRGMDKIERCAAMGFIFLAASDFSFCLVGLPSAFLRHRNLASADQPFQVTELLYSLYRPGLLNIFHFSSTWCIVFIAVERYMVVTHPMIARSKVRLRRSAIFQILIPVISVIINIPHFTRLEIQRTPSNSSNDTGVTLYPAATRMAQTHFFTFTYKILWNLLIAFIPMLILLYCNVQLLVAIYKTRSHGFLNVDKYSTSKITIILVSIVTLYFVLVGPSIILNLFEQDVFQIKAVNDKSYSYSIAVVVSNVLQATNFAINFLLYFGMHPRFRQNLRCKRCGKSDHFQAMHKKEVIHMRIR